ncbi:unnamed protein product [Miscanthus lutarioriparius]|uniref:Uncharacterized protein n=1 Tax=Miscanthus lutarioriparius TaxID=422564 RepID=A0A811QYT3_9POAL|nr:unnamed protein product [Miscanthus lutarioriparius]
MGVIWESSISKSTRMRNGASERAWPQPSGDPGSAAPATLARLGVRAAGAADVAPPSTPERHQGPALAAPRERTGVAVPAGLAQGGGGVRARRLRPQAARGGSSVLGLPLRRHVGREGVRGRGARAATAAGAGGARPWRARGEDVGFGPEEGAVPEEERPRRCGRRRYCVEVSNATIEERSLSVTLPHLFQAML